MPRHLGGEKDDRDKGEQIYEKVNEIRDKRNVEMKHHLIKRGVVLDEAVHVFRHVEHYNHYDEQTDGKEESANEFLENIPVEFSHPFRFLL
jgi:hypothetical protein